MFCKENAQSEPPGTRSDQEKCRSGVNRRRNQRFRSDSKRLQCEPFPSTGDDRKEGDTINADGSCSSGEIIEQLIEDSLAQAKQHEKSAAILRKQANELKNLLAELNKDK